MLNADFKANGLVETPKKKKAKKAAQGKASPKRGDFNSAE
jgi:hypothetical protein